MSGPSDAPSPSATLLALQDVDTAITQHEHRKTTLPERRELEEVSARRQAARRRAAELGTQRDGLATRLGHMEEQTAAVVSRRKALEDRLYGARGAAGRDLAAIEGEVAHLGTRLSQLEDEELALLEEQEPLDAALDQLTRETDDLDARSADLTRRVGEADGEIDAELARLRTEREAKASELPADLARRYEALRTRLGGIGAARLVGDRCDGCHLTLPSVEVDRIRHLPPDELATCDQCGRILVRSSA